MLFNKKEKDKKKCESCSSKVEKKYNYCPFCGNSFLSVEDQAEFGLLGTDDFAPSLDSHAPQAFGITDKLINSMFNNLIKSLDKQMKNQLKEELRNTGNERTEIKTFPNGIRIKVSNGAAPQKKIKQNVQKRTLDEAQIKKMSELPRTKAKSSVKRFGDKVIYELATPGVTSPQDIFISKLESGYEIKAIGNKKVYVNSVPINLPLRKYSILKNKLQVEFNATNE